MNSKSTSVIVIISIIFFGLMIFDLDDRVAEIENTIVINLPPEVVEVVDEPIQHEQQSELNESVLVVEVLGGSDATEDDDYIVVTAKVTAYAPLDNQSGICANSDPTNTATMTYPRVGIVAVDPSRIPYGSEVYIEGRGWLVAEDTGGALRSYEGIQIDICMNTYEEAMSWGVQYMEIKIKKNY